VGRYVAARWTAVAAGLGLLVAGTGLTMALPWLGRRSVEALVAGSPALWPCVGAIAAVGVLQGLLRLASRGVLLRVAGEVEAALRDDLVAHLARVPPLALATERTGDLQSRLVNDVAAVRQLLGPGLVNLVNAPLYWIGGLAGMLALSPRLALATLALHPLAVLCVRRRSRRLLPGARRVREALAELSSTVQETAAGLHVVKAHAVERETLAAFAAVNDDYCADALALARVKALLDPAMTLAAGAGVLVVLWLGGRLVLAHALSVGDLVAFTGTLGLLAVPTAALGWLLTVVQTARAALARIDALFALVPLRTAPVAPPPRPCRGEITLRHVTVRHPGRPDAPPALVDVSLAIPAGSRVALVGATGAGKSSLVQLLPRLLEPASGSVLLDGRDVRTLPLDWLRRVVGFVPQDAFLFSRTVEANVAFALDEEWIGGRVMRALDAAAVAAEVESWPAGRATALGERGATLSGGQRQRLALARVLAAAPRVLVLDDALAGVDAATERAILRVLFGAPRERTTLVVAHRPSTVRAADLIVVLDRGRVVETGDHRSLLAAGGRYAELFETPGPARALEAAG